MRARMPTIEVRDLHRAPASNAPRRLHENSVDLKRKTAEVSSGRFQSKVALRAGSNPQGLRRPRFSFFLFTCQTARNHAVPPAVESEGRRSLTLPMTYRKLGHNISEVLRRRDI